MREERRGEGRKRREERAGVGEGEVVKAGAREGESFHLRDSQALHPHSITLSSQVARKCWAKGSVTSSRSKKLGSDQGYSYSSSALCLPQRTNPLFPLPICPLILLSSFLDPRASWGQGQRPRDMAGLV